MPPTYNTAVFFFFFYIFVATAIAVFCVQLINYFCIFIRRFQELSEVLHIFFNNIQCGLVLLFKNNSLWASISLLTNENVLVLRTDRQGLPEKFFNPISIFNVVFIMVFINLYVFPMFRRSSV